MFRDLLVRVSSDCSQANAKSNARTAFFSKSLLLNMHGPWILVACLWLWSVDLLLF